jgi:ribonuclease J
MDFKKDILHSDSLFLAPFGGLGEIGMNMMVLIWKRKAIAIDCGVLFPEMNQIGLDLVIPRVDFLKEMGITLEAIFLTHAHEDHIGATPYLYSALGKPMLFGTDFTLAMLEERMFEKTDIERGQFRTIRPHQRVSVGSFEVEALTVTHSLVDTIGLAIKTPQGLLLHSGDFKIDKQPVDGIMFDEKRFRELGVEGVDVLLSDSTNVESEGWTESENELASSLNEIICRIKTGKIVVTLFSSNIHRLQSIFDAAKKAGRKVALCGRSVQSNVEIAIRHSQLKVDKSLFVEPRRVEDMDPKEILVIATGSQAEARSALQKMSLHLHPDVSILEGDTVIFSSRYIPGNEKKISALMNQIYRCGARAIDYKDEFVHVSGHARREELRSVIRWAQPKNFLPVHGEYRMLVKHLELAKEVLPSVKGLVAENGQLVEFRKDKGLRTIGRFHWGKVFLDEHRNLISEELIKERKKIAQRGVVTALMSFSKKRKRFDVRPQFAFFGLPTDELDLEELSDFIESSLREALIEKFEDERALEELSKTKMRRFISQRLGIKPIIYSVISIT